MLSVAVHKDKVVAFESLSLNGKELASHADIEDKSQTVTITKPEVGTTAKDGFDGNQTVVSDTEVSVVDTVKYKNVTPGKTYKVTGTLYEKVTDKDGKVSKKQLLDADGNPVTAETEFVPEDTYGTVDVTFTFDGSLLKDNTPVVAFESLSYKGKAESVQANDSKESGSDASTKDGSKSKEKSHTHDWSITYKTVHHDAVTHTEHVAPVYQNQTTYHTVCNECKQVIDGKADEHIKQTGHSGYSTNVPITDEVMVSEGYDKQVTDTPAYDETVIDKLVCTTCGATKDAPQATSDAAK